MVSRPSFSHAAASTPAVNSVLPASAARWHAVPRCLRALLVRASFSSRARGLPGFADLPDQPGLTTSMSDWGTDMSHVVTTNTRIT